MLSRFESLPSLVVAHYLGVPREDRSAFDRWTNAIVVANVAGDVASAPNAALDLFEYATQLIERRRLDGSPPVRTSVGTNRSRSAPSADMAGHPLSGKPIWCLGS